MSVLRPEPSQSTLQEQGNTLRFENVTLSNLSRQQILQQCTYQYITLGRKPLQLCAK
jgi:hypothetical protein